MLNIILSINNDDLIRLVSKKLSFKIIQQFIKEISLFPNNEKEKFLKKILFLYSKCNIEKVKHRLTVLLYS